LANDVVAGQLSLLGQPGLVLSNGEFGSRLVDQARRFNLKFEAVEFPWGKPLDLVAVRKKLDGPERRTPIRHVSASKKLRAGSETGVPSEPPAWLWCVHCETSTGILADLDALKAMCAGRGVKLCLDCVSTIGTMPVDLTGVFFASCSSGKGLRAYPGLAMVFYNHEVTPEPDKLPRYLDLGFCAQQQGIPFTFSSNLLHALHAAVRRPNLEKRFAETAGLSAGLRLRLAEMGFDLIGNGAQTSPAVITIALPPEMNSLKIGEAMQEAGYLLSCNSEYLRRKNWIQICLMGECPREKVVPVVNALNRVCSPRGISPVVTV
jgi:aspartate aminotransferase-like enzyme